MSEKKARVFTRDFKLGAVSRMLDGENVSALARELEIRRKLLYEWRDAYRAGGVAALRGRGRPRKGTEVLGAKFSGAKTSSGAPPGAGAGAELAEAGRRIAELERKIGQQSLELDFFGQALRLAETLRRTDERSGGTAPTSSSRRGYSRKAD